MKTIREFEERMRSEYQQGKLPGFIHIYRNQEAIAVAACLDMTNEDYIASTHRGHGHCIAKGCEIEAMLLELACKEDGLCNGKGGSMHFFAPEKNYWGGHGIVAGQTPLGAGLAFALKYKKIKGCAVCFLGDGAVNQGAFMETLNLVSLWNIPVVFVIENNGYSMGTSLKRSSAEENLAHRADGFDLAWEVCQGHDGFEVREVD